MTRRAENEMPLFVSRETAAKRCEVSVDTFDQWVKEGSPENVQAVDLAGDAFARPAGHDGNGPRTWANVANAWFAISACPLCGGMGRV